MPRPQAPVLRQLRTLATQAQAAPSSSKTGFGHLPAPTAPKPVSLPTTTAGAIDVLRATSTPDAGRYLLARLHSRTYLLHPKDILTIPRLKPAPEVGSTLALTRILEVGSRDFALRSPAANGKELRKQESFVKTEFPSLPSSVVKCELTVLEHTKSPMTRIMLKKRRKGYQRTIENKQEWTRLRVGDIILPEKGE